MKTPSPLARTGISTDPIYLVALILILVGLTVVWVEERMRLLGMLGLNDSGAQRGRYRPQHSIRR